MKYTEIQNEVIQKYRIDICDGTKCKNGDWSRTHAHPKQRRVCKWKQANSIQSTFELFHEIGHIVNNDSKMRRCEQEYHATAWAIEECEKYGIVDKIPQKLIDEYQEYIFDELDRGVRRGGSGYPSKRALTLNFGETVTEKALKKLNDKQMYYCKTMSRAINRAKVLGLEAEFEQTSGKLRGFLDCMLQMKLIEIDEIKALHLWFSLKDRS